ncbi:DUF2470 domain-containing protein [Geodermatophilus sp. DSM 45219]|uniref:DUF2470 domain-containing protein n=1 Tax=Geodermatophilus sp. DSM 45219 TaxID=1881103 RepID=UPI000881AA08|nr:DUF2470 domain-containing protein [Geodermatophilus sp. DSM 45219]SDO08148.1 hypothetical protein SAMN05428965_2736 [Geodermatophilus sp. DSM 45219]
MPGRPTLPSLPADRVADAAERARTAATSPTASVQALGLGSSRLLAAATLDDGLVLVVVPRSGGLAAAVREAPEGDLAAKVTVTSRSAQPLRNPLRARLELAGWLTPVPAGEETELVLAFAAVRPDDVLLDVGLSATLLCLDVAEVLLHEGGGWTSIEPEAYAAARPDPLGAAEDELMSEHAGPLAELRARVQAWAGDDPVHLLGLDRHGVLFRVEPRTGCYDLRTPFPAPLTSTGELPSAVRALLACTS